jgi:hypothetical protein
VPTITIPWPRSKPRRLRNLLGLGTTTPPDALTRGDACYGGLIQTQGLDDEGEVEEREEDDLEFIQAREVNIGHRCGMPLNETRRVFPIHLEFGGVFRTFFGSDIHNKRLVGFVW